MNEEMGKVKAKFEKLFDNKPVIVRSPGRVNLIGEHTDYNEGFVLPAAIDKYIYFAIHPGKDEKCNLYAADLNESCEIDLDSLEKSEKQWANYLVGVLDQLKKTGRDLKGFNCVFGGDIPIGAGLSSSAAIEAGLAFALNELYALGIDKTELVKLSQKAENDFVGVQCGIMDQFINIYGKENKVLKLDCRSLEYEYFPFDNRDLRIILCDTQVKHSLADSEYNLRRKQCEEGVTNLKRFNPSLRSLRDVSPAFIKKHKDDLDPVIYKRCEYVIKENQRVESACFELSNNNFAAFGELMYQSHEGLKNGYEVSCSELDLLVDIAHRVDGVIGGRMMGGGFGGCTINLVYENQIENFKNEVSSKYTEKYDVEPKYYVNEIVRGTEIVNW